MEKLIDYLCEYEGVKNWYATMTTYSMKRELKCCYMLDESKDVIETWVISKAFGFIKWLVENEKIEENSDFITLASELGCAFSSDVLLMYLAIQDEPIEFLVSILK